jgi:hypothetical protein
VSRLCFQRLKKWSPAREIRRFSTGSFGKRTREPPLPSDGFADEERQPCDVHLQRGKGGEGMKTRRLLQSLALPCRDWPTLARPSLTQSFRACLAPPRLAYPGRSRPGRTLPTHACRSTPRLVTTVEPRRASLARAQCPTTTILCSTCAGMPRGCVRTAQGRRSRHWPSQRAQVSKPTHMRNPLKVPTRSVASLGRSTFHVKQPR